MAGIYITTDDIKHRHIKSFPLAELQEYVDRANEWFESHARSIGVAAVDILTPIETITKDLILSWLYVQFSLEASGGEGSTTIDANNLYTSIYVMYEKQHRNLLAQVTEKVLTGENTTRGNSAYNFGKLERA